jgi:hypothetical protein
MGRILDLSKAPNHSLEQTAAATVGSIWHCRDGRSCSATSFAGLQRFLATVHRLTSERRLSRFVYLGRKQGE